ncbi:g3979 [Coccomyxa elongata]
MSFATVDAEKVTIPTASTSRGCHHHFVDRNLSTLKYYCWSSRVTARKAQSLTYDVHSPKWHRTPGIRTAQVTDLQLSSVAVGPRGMLLIGFSKKDGEAVATWMQQMEAGFAVSHCTEDMLKGTVLDALSEGDANEFRIESHTVIAEPLPRLVILSGMSGEETIAIAEHWEMFTGTSPPIMATLVEKLLQRSLQDAIMDIVKSSHMSKSRSNTNADTAGLREMIKKKLDQKQAQAGRRLISRDAQSTESSDLKDPIVFHQKADYMAVHESSWSSSGQKEQKQTLDAASQQAEILRANLPKRAQAPKQAGRREQKANKEKKGFG